MKLEPRATAAGVRLIAHEVLGSTNAEALNLARQGERGPLWVTADRQSAGRGRRGRAWISPPGNLYASLLLTRPADTDFPATDLAAAGAAVSPATLFSALSIKVLGRIAQWNAGEGFSTIRADWLARASGMGEGVRVRLAERELVGRFEALDEAGALVLRLADGSTATIAAGDVFTAAASSPDKAS